MQGLVLKVKLSDHRVILLTVPKANDFHVTFCLLFIIQDTAYFSFILPVAVNQECTSHTKYNKDILKDILKDIVKDKCADRHQITSSERFLDLLMFC